MFETAAVAHRTHRSTTCPTARPSPRSRRGTPRPSAELARSGGCLVSVSVECLVQKCVCRFEFCLPSHQNVCISFHLLSVSLPKTPTRDPSNRGIIFSPMRTKPLQERRKEEQATWVVVCQDKGILYSASASFALALGASDSLDFSSARFWRTPTNRALARARRRPTNTSAFFSSCGQRGSVLGIG